MTYTVKTCTDADKASIQTALDAAVEANSIIIAFTASIKSEIEGRHFKRQRNQRISSFASSASLTLIHCYIMYVLQLWRVRPQRTRRSKILRLQEAMAINLRWPPRGPAGTGRRCAGGWWTRCSCRSRRGARIAQNLVAAALLTRWRQHYL